MNALSSDFCDISKYDSSLKYANNALVLAGKLEFEKGYGVALNNMGICYFDQGNYPASFKNNQEALSIFQKIGDKKGIASCLICIGSVYQHEGNYQKRWTIASKH